MKFPEHYRFNEPRLPQLMSKPGDDFGLFRFKRHGSRLHCIATSGGEDLGDVGLWEHVSVTIIGEPRCPTWEEMCTVKDLFWDEEEAVVQFHPPKSEYVSYHPFCLHLWRYKGEFPRPSSICVGPKGITRAVKQ